jgi:HAMP domain-containing protein
MKLAEAIILRSDMNIRLSRLRERVEANAKVQEGDSPHEPPADLLRQAMALASEIEKIAVRVNRANSSATLPDGRTITQALAERDRLDLQHKTLISVIAATKPETDRYSSREIRWVATLPVAELEARAEEIARQRRELNMQIQAANWNYDVPD